MSENLALYEKVREVPREAQKEIGGGRLKGMTDINPMWRIKILTEQFGQCGIGWKYEITSQRLETGANDEMAVFVDINLYYRQGDEWSAAIPGSGGSMFVSKEKNGMYTDDECFKKALTDAIGVAGKALGVAADIYWQKDKTKYSSHGSVAIDPDAVDTSDLDVSEEGCSVCGKDMTDGQKTLSMKKHGKLLCPDCQKGV